MKNFLSGAVYGSATTFMLVAMVYVTEFGLPDRVGEYFRLMGNL